MSKSLPTQSVVQDIAPVVASKSIDASASTKMSKQSAKGSTLEKNKQKSGKLKPSPKEDKEDAYIAYLESKLGLDKGGKKKGKKATEEEDGLDGTLQCASPPYFKNLDKSYS